MFPQMEPTWHFTYPHLKHESQVVPANGTYMAFYLSTLKTRISGCSRKWNLHSILLIHTLLEIMVIWPRSTNPLWFFCKSGGSFVIASWIRGFFECSTMVDICLSASGSMIFSTCHIFGGLLNKYCKNVYVICCSTHILYKHFILT